jgi:hypothetical protein
MTPEQVVAIITALVALLGAVTAVIVQLRNLHTLVNSRMTQLLDLTQTSARAQGQLDATGGISPQTDVVSPTDASP